MLRAKRATVLIVCLLIMSFITVWTANGQTIQPDGLSPAEVLALVSMQQVATMSATIQEQSARLHSNIAQIQEAQDQVVSAQALQRQLINNNNGKVPTGNDTGAGDYQRAQSEIDGLNAQISQLSSANQTLQIKLQQSINTHSDMMSQVSNMLAKQHDINQSIIENLR